MLAAERFGPLFGHLDIFGGLADIDGDGDDALKAVIFTHHGNGDGRVKAAGINENNGFWHSDFL